MKTPTSDQVRVYSRQIMAQKDIYNTRSGAKQIFQGICLFHKFMEQVENIFKNPPKPLKWLSFYGNDPSLIVHI